jgi:hypothetical protein
MQDGKCPVCGWPAYVESRVPFDVVKKITSGRVEEVERFLCGECAELEAKRLARVEREKVAVAMVAKAMRDNG